MTHRVYNTKTNETIFEGDAFDCMLFMSTNFEEQDEDFPYVWMEEIIVR
ncbi:hypothetical protein [Oceanobacillus oncorhynchi]